MLRCYMMREPKYGLLKIIMLGKIRVKRRVGIYFCNKSYMVGKLAG